jgi:hypothetical protein
MFQLFPYLLASDAKGKATGRPPKAYLTCGYRTMGTFSFLWLFSAFMFVIFAPYLLLLELDHCGAVVVSAGRKAALLHSDMCISTSSVVYLSMPYESDHSSS